MHTTVIEVSATSTGSDWFEWEIHSHCKSVSIKISPPHRCHIQELCINNRSVPISVPDKSENYSFVSIDEDFMLRPKERVRVVVKSRPGLRLQAQLKIGLLD